MSASSADQHDLSRIRILIGEVHEANRDYVSSRLCENIDGLLSCEFVDENKLAELTFDEARIDQFTLMSAIQRLGHSVQMLESDSAQVQLRIDGMHCNSCVSNISSAVLDLPGAMDIELTFRDKLATITFDPSVLPLDRIIDEIEKLNFQVAIATSPQEATPANMVTTAHRAGSKVSPGADVDGTTKKRGERGRSISHSRRSRRRNHNP